jgi:hypothetical protein
MTTPSTPTQFTERTFPAQVHKYLTLDKKLEQMQSELQSVKREHDALGTNVLAYMQSTGVKTCKTDAVTIKVAESMAQAPLSVPLLGEVFAKFFASRPDVGDALLKAIADHRQSSAKNRTRLKRIKKRAPAAAAAAASTTTA